ncbi:unnamed protein product [Brassica oleracea var. botrytis]
MESLMKKTGAKSPLVLSYTFGDTGRRQMELVQKQGKRDR